MVKCVSCKKERKDVHKNNMWICDNCRQEIYLDYTKMLKEKSKNGENISKETNKLINIISKHIPY